MKVVDIVEIEQLITIYKEGSPANAIEVARVKSSEGDSFQFNIVVGKGLYNIGDKAVYIQPDHCIPPTEIFKEYYAPGGDEKKSKMGKNGRIRAIKFNFQFYGESDPIYSNGILIPMSEFDKHFPGVDKENTDLQELLKVVKYVAEDNSGGGSSSGLTAGDRPSFLYETDESNIELLKSHVNKCFDEGEVLGFTLKRDGSSTSEFFKIETDGSERKGICSRKQEKKLDQTYVSWYKEGDYILHPYFNKDTNEKGWMNDFTQKFYTQSEVESNGFEPVITEVRDAWVDTDRKFGYLDKIVDYCKKYNLQLCMRGELVAISKGSGNKYNIDAKGEPRVIWFGVDDLSSGFSTRIHYGQEHNLKKVSDELGFEYTLELWEGVFNYDEIIKKCNEYFKKRKEETGEIVEGIVIRSKYSNKLSTKYINPEYDSKK